jgi:hypothetical protein
MNLAYANDFYAWTREQADALRRRSPNELDWDNLLEEVESLGRSVRNELDSRFKVLAVHLIKWRFQPNFRCRSWTLTLKEQRREIERLLASNPSVRPEAEEIFTDAYERAVLRAQSEMGFDPEIEGQIFTAAQALEEAELLATAPLPYDEADWPPNISPFPERGT